MNKIDFKVSLLRWVKNVVSFTLISIKNKTKEPYINRVPTVTLGINLLQVFCFKVYFCLLVFTDVNLGYLMIINYCRWWNFNTSVLIYFCDWKYVLLKRYVLVVKIKVSRYMAEHILSWKVVYENFFWTFTCIVKFYSNTDK